MSTAREERDDSLFARAECSTKFQRLKVTFEDPRRLTGALFPGRIGISKFRYL